MMQGRAGGSNRALVWVALWAAGCAEPSGADEDAGPAPIDLRACTVVSAGELQKTRESSGLAALPGASAGGRPLLVTHGDEGLTANVVDDTGRSHARFDILPEGDFEDLALIDATEADGARRYTLVALRSPGNGCVRGEGPCDEGALVRFGLTLREGEWSLRPDLAVWSLPAEARTDAEALAWLETGLLVLAKETGDADRLVLVDGAREAEVHPLLRADQPGERGRVTGATRDAASGRLFATSRRGGEVQLLELEPATLAVRHAAPLPADLANTRVEALAVLPDGTLALTNEEGRIVRYRCGG